MNEPKSKQLEARRQTLEVEAQTAKADTAKIMLEIALVSLAAQVEMLRLIERNVRN